MCGHDYAHFIFIAIEKEPPYAVALYRLKQEAIDLGQKEIALLLPLYKTCSEANSWPSYPQTVTDVGLPTYAYKQETESFNL